MNPQLQHIDFNAAGAPMMPAEARIIDPVLTTHAIGYRHPSHVWPVIAPRVRTATRGGKLTEFDDTTLHNMDTERAPGAELQLVSLGHEGRAYALDQHALGGLVPVEPAQDAEAVPGIDLGMGAVEGVQKILSLRREIETAQLVTAAANYDATHVTTLTGTARWNNATSDPAKTVAALVEIIRRDTGIRPNTAIVPGDVKSVLQYHPDLIDVVKRGPNPRSRARADDIAAWWDMENVAIADAIYVPRPGAAKAGVWGKDVVIAYTELGTMMMPEPTFAYSYTLNGAAGAGTPFFLSMRNSWVYPVFEEWSTNIVFKAEGALIKTVID